MRPHLTSPNRMLIAPLTSSCHTVAEFLCILAFRLKERQRVAVARPYNEKSLKSVLTRFFRTGIAEVAVLKDAICQSKLDLVRRVIIFSDDEMRRNTLAYGDPN